MKYIFISTLLVTFSVWAKTPAKDLSKELGKDIQKDIQKDDEKFRKTNGRFPASAEPLAEPRIDDTPKLDKNVRQIGPNKW